VNIIFLTIALLATDLRIGGAQDQHSYTPCLSDLAMSAPIASASQQWKPHFEQAGNQMSFEDHEISSFSAQRFDISYAISYD